MVIYTIGHSTRSWDEFVELLRVHEIARLGDIRTVPRSRRHPHFSAEHLDEALGRLGIDYRHLAGLGGLRKPRRDSRNGAWRHEGFRGYADYMETTEFATALTDLIAWATDASRVAIMCAEAVWWRCHRQLTADALLARGVEVRHVTSTGLPAVHVLTDFARVVDGQVRYPGLL